MCPCPSQEKSYFRTSAALAPRGPRDLILPNLWLGSPVTRLHQYTQRGVFLRNLLKITRIEGEVNEIGPASVAFR